MSNVKTKKKVKKKARVRRGQMVKTGGKRDYRCYMKIGSKGSGKSTDARDDIDDYLDIFGRVYSGVCHPRVFVHDYSQSRAFSDIMTVQEYVMLLEKSAKKRIYINHPYGEKDKDGEIKRVRLLDWPEEVLDLKDKNGEMVWDGSVVKCLRSITTRPNTIKRIHNLVFRNLTNAFVVFDECSVYMRMNPPDWQTEILINHRNKGLEVCYMFHQLMIVPRFYSRSDFIYSITLFKTGENSLRYKQLDRYSCHDRIWEAFKRVKAAPKQNTRAQYNETIIV